ncbi:MAG: dihydrodipicolinate synthase family protein [Kiritimatiellae bacterium]|nr:dihydrodipicolinate synthase family protein [Kiritimatiellia bacterium]
MKTLTRRELMCRLAECASVAALAGCRTGKVEEETVVRTPIWGNPRIRGLFPILSTPFLESGEVDFDTLASEARFVDFCECSGMIWPQSSDSCDFLTKEEKKRGMRVLSEALKGRASSLCLGVQGRDTKEMLEFAELAETLRPMCIISRPPDNGKTEDDLRAYYHALASVFSRPVIIQTSGGSGYKGPAPSVNLLVELATEYPKIFGYVKEESVTRENGKITETVDQRIALEVAKKPSIKRVFSAQGGRSWLYQARQLGTEGLITERVAYADLLARIWQLLESHDSTGATDAAFAGFLLMLNLENNLPGGTNGLRGYHLYVMQMRGVFRNLLSRKALPTGKPDASVLTDVSLTEDQKAEVISRFRTLQPFLKI